MPPTRRLAPRRTTAQVRGLVRFLLQYGPSTPPMPPAGPGAWAADLRAKWRTIRAELPPAERWRWEAAWALERGVPDELRLLPGLQAVGVDQISRRAAWLASHPGAFR
jgi:hypothetical protein